MPNLHTGHLNDHCSKILNFIADFHFLGLTKLSFSDGACCLDYYKKLLILNAKLSTIFPMLSNLAIKICPLSAVPVVEFCKQMRFLLFALMGNVNDRYDYVSV